MDLLLIVLVAVVMLLLALRGRRKRKRAAVGPRAPHRSVPPRSRSGWSFSRHPREDWRYWRDLAIIIALVLALVVAMIVIGARNG
ncbi:MAG: hypothetical protein ABR561_02150 [Guyparkeria sp.]